jgi:hypothetical protein
MSGPFLGGSTQFVLEWLATKLPAPTGAEWVCEVGDYGWGITLTLDIHETPQREQVRLAAIFNMDKPDARTIYEAYESHWDFLRGFALWQGVHLRAMARHRGWLFE